MCFIIGKTAHGILPFGPIDIQSQEFSYDAM
jgi:hypothetical protein